MSALIALILSLTLRAAPDRTPAHVTCYDGQGHRVEFVVLRSPANRSAFCLERGLLPNPPRYYNRGARPWSGQ